MSEADLHAYNNPDLSKTGPERVNALWYSITHDPNYDGWDTQVLKGVELISATVGRCEFEMTVTKAMCNKGNILHGGCATTVLDALTSTTFLTIAKPGYLDGGTVSRTLTMTFLRPVPAGSKVRLICESIAAGKATAHCRGIIQTMDGKVCVSCVHDKAVLPKQVTKAKL